METDTFSSKLYVINTDRVAVMFQLTVWLISMKRVYQPHGVVHPPSIIEIHINEEVSLAVRTDY